MSHPRALTEQSAIDLEQWFTDYERVGTVDAKARELGISKDTLYDTVRRVRGLDTRVVRKKVAHYTAEYLKALPCRPCRHCGTEHSRRHESGRPRTMCEKCATEYNNSYRLKYSEMSAEQKMKSNARSMANTYVRRGKLVRQPCAACNAPDAEKHHDDYSKPLEVRWLCRSCHMKEHRETA